MHFLYLCLIRSQKETYFLCRDDIESTVSFYSYTIVMQMRTWAGLLTWHYSLQYSAGTNVNHAVWFRAYQRVLLWFIAVLSVLVVPVPWTLWATSEGLRLWSREDGRWWGKCCSWQNRDPPANPCTSATASHAVTLRVPIARACSSQIKTLGPSWYPGPSCTISLDLQLIHFYGENKDNKKQNPAPAFGCLGRNCRSD